MSLLETLEEISISTSAPKSTNTQSKTLSAARQHLIQKEETAARQLELQPLIPNTKYGHHPRPKPVNSLEELVMNNHAQNMAALSDKNQRVLKKHRPASRRANARKDASKNRGEAYSARSESKYGIRERRKQRRAKGMRMY
mmetsp:Transcript_7400/g.9162  ORF Transcript_7400/g.9162 Transcript_7400/m.9162 type:complete len:141 (-) Transcript_7400:49-471(-)